MTGGFTGGGNQKKRAPAADPSKWNKGLLSCCKEDEMNPFCLQTFCCPCVIYGRIVSEMTVSQWPLPPSLHSPPCFSRGRWI